jgi:hypothetical protein
VAVTTPVGDVAVRLSLSGEPDEIVESTCQHCFDLQAEHLGRVRPTK